MQDIFVERERAIVANIGAERRQAEGRLEGVCGR